MKVIIAGSRSFSDFPFLVTTVQRSGFNVAEVVSGGAAGADVLGESYAKLNDIPLTIFKADWDTHGKAAGPIRNRQMAAYADALIAFWDGKSRGTMNMIQEAKKKYLQVYVVNYGR